MQTLKRYSPAQIRTCIKKVWENLDSSIRRPGISPLYEIIGSYPIRIDEIERLTFQSAAQYLSSKTGQIIPVPRDGKQALAGFLFIQRYRKAFYGCILVEQKDPIVRRRFSAAHELGHYLLHFLPLLESEQKDIDLILAEGLMYSKDSIEELPVGQLAMIESPDHNVQFNFIGNETVEREANQFAADLLIPEAACRQMYGAFSSKYGTKDAIITKRLATEFLVSAEAMKWRLIALKLQGS